MTSSIDTPAGTGDSEVAPARLVSSRPSRLNQAAAWVGIVAGGLFIVAGVFFSGYFPGWRIDGPAHSHGGQMDCCSGMKPGDMKPGAMMGPAQRSTPPGTPRP